MSKAYEYGNRLENDYSFNKFFILESNKKAYECAKKFASRINKKDISEMLLIHGYQGSGTTYMLHAIGNYILKTGKRKVKLISGFKLVNLLQNEKGNNGLNLVDVIVADTDILLCDDIEVVGFSDESQKFFLQIINKIQEKNGSLVVTTTVVDEFSKFNRDLKIKLAGFSAAKIEKLKDCEKEMIFDYQAEAKCLSYYKDQKLKEIISKTKSFRSILFIINQMMFKKDIYEIGKYI